MRYVTPPPDSLKLGRWAHEQRQLNRGLRNGVLPHWKRELLDSVGFEWDPRADEWNRYIHDLTLFRERFGHCRVPQSYRSSSGLLLGRWVANRRADGRAGRLAHEHETQLRALGFDFGAPPPP